MREEKGRGEDIGRELGWDIRESSERRSSVVACKLRYAHTKARKRERRSQSGLVIYSSHESRIRRDKANATLEYLFTDFLSFFSFLFFL